MPRVPTAGVAPPKPGDVGAETELDLGPAPDAAQIARIVGRADPVLRNLEITLAYYRLSRSLRRMFGPSDATWCTFATWASRRAGRSIRGEDLGTLRDHLRRRLEHDERYEGALARLRGGLLRRRLPPSLDKQTVTARVLNLVDDVGASVAEGNLAVFAELAPPFSDLIAQFEGDSAFDRQKLDRFVARFAPGPTGEGGQDLLRAAFTSFADAMFEPDPKARAELLLLANVLVGLHEQTRLQAPIRAALDAPIEHLGAWFAEDIRATSPLKGRLLRSTRVDLLGPLLAVVGRIWREEATKLLMTLPVPGETLGLGWDIPAPSGRPMFPPQLQVLSNPDLVAALAPLDRTRDTTRATGALDWSSLDDRMHYIADLFRSRQQQPTLYFAPFTADQCRAILDGRVPDGAL